jgi:DNA ligase (NAD+)
MAYLIPTDVDALEKLVRHLATLYDLDQPCVDFDGELVEDSDYDKMVRELARVKPESEAFAPGTNSPSTHQPTGTNLVTHNPPMTSIAKADGTLEKKTKIYGDWLKDCKNALGHTPQIVQAYKHDGVACSIVYKNGKLQEAGLKPRMGILGVNVTENVKYVKGVPTTLPLPLTLTVRGELECLHDDFVEVQKRLKATGDDLRANPRNHTAGAINQSKDPSKTKVGLVSFMGYNVVSFDDAEKHYKTHLEMAKWVNQVLLIPFVRTMPHNFDDLATMEAGVKGLPYEVDGVVLRVNSIEDFEQLGHHGDDPVKEPRGALAWKFEEERAQAIVGDMEYSTSRTGRVPPVAIFETPVLLAGTMVSRATCSNIGWLKRMKIGKGTVVSVYKAGKIIPKIEAVISGHISKVDHPTHCSACGCPLVVQAGNDGNEDLICQYLDCSARHVEGIVHYLSVVGAKGLGASKIETIIKTGKVKNLAGIYDLNVKDLVDVGFSLREALLAVATIHHVTPTKDDKQLSLSLDTAKHTKKSIPLWQFFAALGIPGAGKTVGKVFSDKYKKMETILDLTYDDLVGVDGIGDTTAKNIADYIHSHRHVVEKLLTFVEPEGPKTGKLSGLTFCLSGTMVEGKSYWEQAITNLGGKVSGNVGKSVDYLVAGPGSVGKTDAANELIKKQAKIKIIDEDTMKKML